jgi:Ca2+-binding RTX toxin-like protein
VGRSVAGRSVRGVRLLVAVLVVCSGLAVASVTPSGATPPVYPSPPPNFAHPSTPHDTLYSLDSGKRDRKLLVIVVTIGDIDSPSANMTAWARQRYFGGFPSATDYFRSVSRSNLILTPADESQGTANDGVVVVNTPTAAGFIGNPEDEIAKGVTLADPWVDFSDFNDIPDGILPAIDNRELAVVVARTGPGCGAARTLSNGGVGFLDGMFVGGLLGATLAAGSTSDSESNLMTIVHELHHELFFLGRDDYGWGASQNTSLGAGTCPSTGVDSLWLPAAWERLHWGWSRTTVVTRDGYRRVRPAHSVHDAVVLYDPERGTNEYLVVENRQGGVAGTYDQDVSDSGLMVWRMKDSNFKDRGPGLPGEAGVPFFSLVKPNTFRFDAGSRTNNVVTLTGIDTGHLVGAGSVICVDATDNSYDDCHVVSSATSTSVTYTQAKANDASSGDGAITREPHVTWDPDDSHVAGVRTVSPLWSNFDRAKIAVRAIDRDVSDTLQAFFDVRGPGVLVDGRNLRNNTPSLTPTLGQTLSFPVRNTQDAGEPGGSFDFSVVVPSGWSTTTHRLGLAAQGPGTANVTVTPGFATAPGTYTLYLKGISSSDPNVVTTDAFKVRVTDPARVSVSGNTINYVAGADQLNDLTTTPGTDTLTFVDPPNNIVAGPGCTRLATGVRCSTIGVTATRIDGRDRRDTLRGSPLPDTLVGGTGPDTFFGNAGEDTVDYSGNTSRVTVTINDASGDGSAGENDNVRTDIENVIGSDFNDSITGSAATNELDGGPGNDDIHGGANNDTLVGDTGNDTASGGSGTDIIEGGNGDDTLNGGTERDDLLGGYGTDQLNGGDGDDVLDGGPGYDGLNGPSDAGDVISGGNGHDWVSYYAHLYAVNVTLDGAANDGVLSHNENDNVLTDVEDLTGTRLNDRLIAPTSNIVSNSLFGAEGDDYIAGGGGDDSLFGEAGTDTFTGQAGNDTLYAANTDADGKLDCGTDNDTVRRDTIDPNPIGCETINTV